ncbi:hypothetical protein [Halostella litorea]|uniref:hypothetical protein n=1 Tax=Halostella litorea TaxID=2528831 RepID=UPI0010920986|nr:hypothetical protein [Halostella litorea]
MTPTPSQTGDADPEPFTRERLMQIHQDYREANPDATEGAAVLDFYLTPASRARILRAFVGWPNEELSASDIYGSGDDEGLADVSPATFTRQIDALTALEAVEETRRMNGSPLYQVNQRHPVVQALGMADNLAQHGETPLLVDDDFIGQVGEK